MLDLVTCLLLLRGHVVGGCLKRDIEGAGSLSGEQAGKQQQASELAQVKEELTKVLHLSCSHTLSRSSRSLLSCRLPCNTNIGVFAWLTDQGAVRCDGGELGADCQVERGARQAYRRG
eukprot:1257686-Rhodomonas_salina.2